MHPRASHRLPAPVPQLDAPDVEALRIGLSYVLHESSSSRTVREHVRAVRDGYRRATRALHKFMRLDDDEFLTRLVFRDEASIERLQREAPPSFLSIQLGASPLLARALSLVLPPHAPEPSVWWLDTARPDARRRSIPAFRTDLHLAWPPDDAPISWFAVLVFRPGRTSLLLDAVPLDRHDPVTHLGRTLERALREYADQWWARGRWWDRPAEGVYPELREGNR